MAFPPSRHLKVRGRLNSATALLNLTPNLGGWKCWCAERDNYVVALVTSYLKSDAKIKVKKKTTPKECSRRGKSKDQKKKEHRRTRGQS